MINQVLKTNRILRTIDQLTPDRILLIGVIALVLSSIVFCAGVLLPLDHSIKQSQDVQVTLQSEVNTLKDYLQSLQSQAVKQSQIPETVEYLRKYFILKGLSIEEILIPSLSVPKRQSISPVVLKVTAIGEREALLGAVSDLQNNPTYPFMIQDLTIQQQRAQINIKLLAHDQP